MSDTSFNGWQSVQAEVLRRIHAREWPPGELIPNEADLALEFGCARATVNRALRAVADSGLLDRRRKSGTRVALQPVAKATLDIAVIRREVEDRGLKYGYHLLACTKEIPPAATGAALHLAPRQPALHVQALHLADSAPYAFENRWINLDVVPGASCDTFRHVSANEWLLENAPYTHGQIAFSASAATAHDAEVLSCPPASSLLTLDRTTWDNQAVVTRVRLMFRPGHQMRAGL